MKNILIINGHPDRESFNWAIVKAYGDAARKSSAEVETINLVDLDFDPILKYGYRKPHPLEPDLETAIEKIKEANHLVWVFPMWWYGVPAVLKGFIDRTFLPGTTFKYQKGKLFPDKLLKGKTARIIVTADTVSWYNNWVMKNPVINQFKKGVLEFCGVKPVKVTYLAPIKSSNISQRWKWLLKVSKQGKRLQ
ncbi:NAD(P)H-dependent oxidoreductase [Flavobacteriaceae bacterium GF1]